MNQTCKQTALERYGRGLICFLLTAAVIVIYRQVGSFDFIAYDDISYLVENRHVQSGFTREGLMWALADFSTGYWHPLTWLSHMLDWHLFGMNAGGHHWMNLLFHLANTLLLFLLLDQMTGEMKKSALVAALFATHPLNVESVAWVAERKNLLSTFFWLSAMGAYVWYAERPSFLRYGAVFLLFALGLLTKPMVVTFPFALLLLDYWPLRRFEASCVTSGVTNHESQPLDQSGITNHKSRFFLLVKEKLPLFLLTVAVSIFTYWAGRLEGAVTTFADLPLRTRLINALLAYTGYLANTFWPLELSVFYPYGRVVSLFQIALSGLVVVVMTALVLAAWRKLPSLFTGWFWYMGTLVPVIGLVQAGAQSRADRYNYLPAMGLYMMFAWGIPYLVRTWPDRRILLPVISAMVIPALIFLSWRQTAFWKDSITLFSHAIAVTRANALAHNNLGAALAKEGDFSPAMVQYRKALQIKPDYPEAMNNLGAALIEEGNPEEAVPIFRELLKLKPRYAAAHNNLGIILTRQGKVQEALDHYMRAVALNPEFADAHNNLGCLLAEQKRQPEALPHFQEALRLQPANAQFHYYAGLAFLQLGRLSQARQYFHQALDLNGNFEAAKQQLEMVDKIKKSK